MTSEYELPVQGINRVSNVLLVFPFFFMFCIYLDSTFLSGWLDDIGLPQYKTQFDEGRVDGRMLHYMTVVSVMRVIRRLGLLHAVFHHQ